MRSEEIPRRDEVPAQPVASDTRLATETRQRIAAEPSLVSTRVIVQAENGVIRLWGVVGTRAEQFALETIAREVPGSQGVDSHLLVRSELSYFSAARRWRRANGEWAPAAPPVTGLSTHPAG